MSKVNVDEIQVGDLVGYTFEDDKCLGYVVERYDGGLRAFWSDSLSECNENFEDEAITGHWKVINFDELPESPFTEEENKMDELKVYTGKETIEALLEGKVLENNKYQYRLNDGGLQTLTRGDWTSSQLTLNDIYVVKFTEVVTPQVGDWVKVYLPDKIIAGEITEISDLAVRIEDSLVSLKHYWEILSPEQVYKYKREQAFTKVGRKLNEFKHGDIVLIDGRGVVAVVVSKKNVDFVVLHGLNETDKGYNTQPNQLTPISFIEQQVDLS